MVLNWVTFTRDSNHQGGKVACGLLVMSILRDVFWGRKSLYTVSQSASVGIRSWHPDFLGPVKLPRICLEN